MKLYHKIVHNQPWVRVFGHHAWTFFFWTFTTYPKEQELGDHFIAHERGHVHQAFWITIAGIIFNIGWTLGTGASRFTVLLSLFWWPVSYFMGMAIGALEGDFYHRNPWERLAERRAQRFYPIANQDPRWS